MSSHTVASCFAAFYSDLRPAERTAADVQADRADQLIQASLIIHPPADCFRAEERQPTMFSTFLSQISPDRK